MLVNSNTNIGINIWITTDKWCCAVVCAFLSSNSIGGVELQCCIRLMPPTPHWVSSYYIAFTEREFTDCPAGYS